MAEPTANPPQQPAAPATNPAPAAGASAAQKPAAATKAADEGSAASKPLEGRTTLDEKLVMEVELLSYAALKNAAAHIVNSLPAEVKQSAIVVQSDADLAAAGIYRAFLAQMNALRNAFDDIEPAPRMEDFAITAAAIVGTIVAVTGIVTAVSDLIARFRVDAAIHAVSTTIDPTAYIALVAGRLAKAGAKVFVPSILALPASGDRVQEALIATRDAAASALARVNAQTDAAKKAASSARQTALQAVLDGYVTELAKAGADGVTVMSVLARGEAFAAFLDEKQPYTLFLKALRAGGSHRVQHGMMHSKDDLEFSGAVIVDYIVFAPDGSVAAASTVCEHTGYVDDIRERVTSPDV